MMVPVAMLELIGRFFGFNAIPDYSGVLSVVKRDPYRSLRNHLAQSWNPIELTDYNSDLAFVYALSDHPDQLTVRLSMVGPYALMLAGDGRIVNSTDVSTILRDAGFSSVDKEVLETPVELWRPEVIGCVYEFLFEFDQGLPWDRVVEI